MELDRSVLITGCSGFIGRHLIKTFIKHNTQFYIYDIKEPPIELPEGRFIKGDIFDLQQLKQAVEHHNVIIHLVGLADSAVVQREPMQSFMLNLVSLQNLLESCRIFKKKKVVFPSSAAVYGLTEDLPVKESFHLNPTNTYSWHKYLCEKMLLAYHRNYGIDYVSLRLFNVYGQGNKGVIDFFIEKAKNKEAIESFGPYQYRDFVYAGDVAEAFHKAAIYEKTSNRVVNIGSGNGFQIRDILDLICEIFPEVKWTEMKSDFVMYDSIADITLARILLDFKPDGSREFMKKIISEEMI